MLISGPNHYELFGVEPGCTLDELRAAYRRLALRHHPDVAGRVGGPDPAIPTAAVAGMTMAEINEAWRVLSDSRRRASYDEQMAETRVRLVREPVATPQPAPQTTLSRRRAWAVGVQGQIAKLARLAGRSATQALLIRHPRGARADYEAVLDQLLMGLIEDTESRVRSARAAGAAPLDLAVTATLVGIRTLADRLRRDASLGVSTETLMAAELLDRMWDILAHELPVQLVNALGGNPRAARSVLERDRVSG
jgi:hypothetical protein